MFLCLTFGYNLLGKVGKLAMIRQECVFQQQDH